VSKPDISVRISGASVKIKETTSIILTEFPVKLFKSISKETILSIILVTFLTTVDNPVIERGATSKVVELIVKGSEGNNTSQSDACSLTTLFATSLSPK